MLSPQYETPGGGGGGLNKVLYGWLRPFIYPIHIFVCTIFERKATPFVYLLLTNSNPFHIPILELVIPLPAVIA